MYTIRRNHLHNWLIHLIGKDDLLKHGYRYKITLWLVPCTLLFYLDTNSSDYPKKEDWGTTLQLKRGNLSICLTNVM
jgi:hypothetical protein